MDVDAGLALGLVHGEIDQVGLGQDDAGPAQVAAAAAAAREAPRLAGELGSRTEDRVLNSAGKLTLRTLSDVEKGLTLPIHRAGPERPGAVVALATRDVERLFQRGDHPHIQTKTGPTHLWPG